MVRVFADKRFLFVSAVWFAVFFCGPLVMGETLTESALIFGVTYGVPFGGFFCAIMVCYPWEYT